MAARKARTAAQKDHTKDLRLQRRYGITLARQNKIRAEQDNRCKICRVEFAEDNPPNTDHYHFKIVAKRSLYGNPGPKQIFYGWTACGVLEDGQTCVMWGKTKAVAISQVRTELAPRSIRGLLCRKCNRGLGYIERFFDGARHPENLLPVLEYFRNSLTVR